MLICITGLLPLWNYAFLLLHKGVLMPVPDVCLMQCDKQKETTTCVIRHKRLDYVSCWKKINPHCKNKKSGKPSSSAYTDEKFRMENPDFRVDIQSSFVRWRHQSHILHKKIKPPLPFTPIHLSFRIYVYLCLFHNLINHNLVRHSILKVYSSFWLYNQRAVMT